MTDYAALLGEPLPIWGIFGFALESLDRERAVLTCEVRPELMHSGVLHGGVLTTLIDSVCAVAALAQTLPAGNVTTTNLNVMFLKAVTGGTLRAEGICVKPGRQVLTCEAHVYCVRPDQPDELVGMGTSQLVRVPHARTGA